MPREESRSSDSSEQCSERPLWDRYPVLAQPGYWTLLEENARAWANEVTAGPFWSEAKKRLDSWRIEYRSKSMDALLARLAGLPPFGYKEWTSCERKLRMKCCRDGSFVPVSDGYPQIPQIHDLVRTRIVCKYIDGVEYLAEQIVELAKKFALQPNRERQGRLTGYFAQHVNFTYDVFYREGGVPTPTKVLCEIQLATELSTRMWDDTHFLYEEARQQSEESHEWQWKPEDPRFIGYQLGHVMHLADGLLANIRDLSHRGSKGFGNGNK
jgi:hypothetical protein